MADITFDAKLREKAGKGAARACRREGRVPAVVYGGNKEALMISLDPVQLEKLRQQNIKIILVDQSNTPPQAMGC